MKINVLYLTASSQKEAEKLSRIVISEHLAACANILGKIKSIYFWDGECQEKVEIALILKTSEKKTEELISRITDLHSYQCPCIIVNEITEGHKGFLEWINTETK